MSGWNAHHETILVNAIARGESFEAVAQVLVRTASACRTRYRLVVMRQALETIADLDPPDAGKHAKAALRQIEKALRAKPRPVTEAFVRGVRAERAIQRRKARA